MGVNKYNTNQRELILNYLIKHKDSHITVDEIQFHLKEMGTSVGKATIYRYFDLLMADGQLRKYEGVGGKSACYQYVKEGELCHHHYHLMCDVCGELFHVECEYLDKINSHLVEQHGFRLNSFVTVFHGLCKKCGANAQC